MSGAGPEVLFGSNQRPKRVSIPPFHLLQERTHLRHQTRYSFVLVETNHSTLYLLYTFVSDHALVKCSIILPHQAAHTPNKVQYRRYHHSNMSNFCSDLKNTSFLKSPTDSVVDLYNQYVHDLADVLDKHAPLISRVKKKDSTDWVSDSYRRAKSLRRQFERTWRRTKNPLNRSRLHRQIARCNSLVNKDKSNYYSKLISDNRQDPTKLWHVL